MKKIVFATLVASVTFAGQANASIFGDFFNALGANTSAPAAAAPASSGGLVIPSGSVITSDGSVVAAAESENTQRALDQKGYHVVAGQVIISAGDESLSYDLNDLANKSKSEIAEMIGEDIESVLVESAVSDAAHHAATAADRAATDALAATNEAVAEAQAAVAEAEAAIASATSAAAVEAAAAAQNAAVEAQTAAINAALGVSAEDLANPCYNPEGC